MNPPVLVYKKDTLLTIPQNTEKLHIVNYHQLEKLHDTDYGAHLRCILCKKDFSVIGRNNPLNAMLTSLGFNDYLYCKFGHEGPIKTRCSPQHEHGLYIDKVTCPVGKPWWKIF